MSSTSTTYPEFGATTEGLEVAEKFGEQIIGKTVLITGVHLNGIGFTTAQAFASQSPSCLIFAGRAPSRLQESIDALKLEFPKVDYRALKLDLSSQKAVRGAATELLSWNDIPAIDMLINNAAIMNIPERRLSPEGIELQFATNHIGHFLFTNLILPKLLSAAKRNPKGTTRIINISSLSPTSSRMRWSDINQYQINKTLPLAEQPSYKTHKLFGAIDPEEKSYLPLEGYNQSKVANLLFSIATTKRLYEKFGILSLALHPGVVETELSRDAGRDTKAAIEKFKESGVFQIKTLGAGAATTLVAALDPRLGVPGSREDGYENFGAFLMDCKISDGACAGAVDSGEAERLWRVSEGLVGEEFVW